MTRYDDDDAVITLLKDAVPVPPEAPERFEAVRRKAGRQRQAAFSQTLGCLALAVAIVGGTVAVRGTGQGLELPSDPRLALSMAIQRTARFDTARFEGHTTSVTTRKDDTTTTSYDVSGVYRFSTRDMRFRLTIEDRTVEYLVVGGVTYLREVDGPTDLPAGKRWMRSARPAKAPEARSATEVVSSTLKNATSVRELGRDRVRGVATIRYEVMHPSPGEGAGPIRMELWVDGRGLLRRFDMTATGTDDDESGEVRVRGEYWDYGTDVDIKAPPADQVVDEKETGTTVPLTDLVSPSPGS